MKAYSVPGLASYLYLQVLDEIGIEVQQKLSGVGVANKALPQQQRTKVGADTSDIEARLRQLQDP